MPKISVIVPVYNTQKYLEKCLKSILSQGYQEFEIIIVNDGSTDDSQIIINEYVKKYPEKVKCLEKENGGLSSARNAGIENATGDYIAFIDSDDYIDNNLFTKLLPYMEKKIDLIKFKLVKVDEQYKELEKIDGPVFDDATGQEAFNRLVFDDILLEPACLYLYKKSLFDIYKFRFRKDTYHEDFGLIPLIMLSSKKMVSCDFYGYYYVQVNNSITREDNYKKTVKRANDLLVHYDNMLEQIEKFNLLKKTINNIKQYYSNSILETVKKLKKEEEKKYILEIKKRKLIKNIKVRNIKSLFKKMILILNIRLYLLLK